MPDLVPAEDPGVPPLGSLVEALSADRASVASLTRVLNGVLSDALPPGIVDVEYERTMSDRLKGRAGEPVALRVTLGERVLTVSQRRGQVDAEVARAVRGVVLSRSQVSMTEWITELADGMRSLAQRDTAAREALQRLLLG